MTNGNARNKATSPEPPQVGQTDMLAMLIVERHKGIQDVVDKRDVVTFGECRPLNLRKLYLSIGGASEVLSSE